eukprot:12206557-Ditylum_brightwellii.AAC.1
MLIEVVNDASHIISEIEKSLTTARKASNLIQENAAAARDTHLEDLFKQHLKNTSGDLAATIRNIKHCKELKQAFQNMRAITKGITGGVVSKLLVPNTEAMTSPAMFDKVFATLGFAHTQSFNILDNQDKVLSTLVKQNKLHLHKTFNTPFVGSDM